MPLHHQHPASVHCLQEHHTPTPSRLELTPSRGWERAAMTRSNSSNRLQWQLPAGCSHAAAAVLWYLVLVLPVHTARASRVARLPLQVGPTNNQHVQFTIAIQDVTCSDLPHITATQTLADRFRGVMRQDVITYLKDNQETDAAGTVKSEGDNCSDSEVGAGTSQS